MPHAEPPLPSFTALAFRAAIAAVLTVAVAACGDGGAKRDDGGEAASPGPTTQERQTLHDGLDAIGRVCSAKGERAGGERIASREVRRLLAFQRRYPRQRFALERGGETGAMLSVLLVARSELVDCSPASVAAIDRGLPPEVREALPPARGSAPN